MLHLVRHARPRIEPGVPAAEWSLAAEAEMTALARSGRLPADATWFSSPEPKALATARSLTGEPVQVVDELAEQRRAATWFGEAEDFRAVVRRAFALTTEPAADGWEPLLQTAERVTSAVRRLADRSEGHVVLVGHGTAWTLVISELTGEPPDVEAWERLAMPDHCALVREGGAWCVARPWTLGREMGQCS